MKTVILLFGEMGTGKSYLGKKYAAEKGWPFIEGDDLLPEDMKEAVRNFGRITTSMLQRMIHIIMLEVVKTLVTNDGVVVAQALYNNEDRATLIRLLELRGYAVYPRWVRATWWQTMKQLWSRPKGFRWVLYWLASGHAFEEPKHPHSIIQNKRK